MASRIEIIISAQDREAKAKLQALGKQLNQLGQEATKSGRTITQGLTAFSRASKDGTARVSDLARELARLNQTSSARLIEGMSAAGRAAQRARADVVGLDNGLSTLQRRGQSTQQVFQGLGADLAALSRTGRTAGVQLNQSLGMATAASRGLSSQLGIARGNLLALAGGFAAIRLGSGIFRAAAELQAINAALVAVTGSSDNAAMELEFVRSESNRLGLNLRAVSGDYAKLTAATKGTALEGEKTRQVFTSIVQAGTVLGLSSEKVSLALNAIQQIASKGTVSMEELRGQLGDQIPGAVPAFAEALGVSTEKLFEMVEANEVLATDLPKLAEVLNRRFGGGLEQATSSATAQLNRFRTAVFDLQVAFADSGFLSALTDGMEELAETMKDPEFRESMRELGATLATALNAAVPVLQFIANHLGIATAGFIALKLSGPAALLAIAGAATQAATGVGLVGLALRALPGFGIFAAGTAAIVALASAIGAAASKYQDLRRRKQEAEERNESVQRIINDTVLYKDELALTDEAFKKLTATEQAGYLQRLQNARDYYQQRKAQEQQARRDEQRISGKDQSSVPFLRVIPQSVIENARQERELSRALNRQKTLNAQRLNDEKSFEQRVLDIKKKGRETLKEQLDAALEDRRDFNRKLKDVQEENKDIEQEFEDALAKIKRGHGGRAEPSFIDAASLTRQARDAIEAGDIEEALRLAREATRTVDELNEAGKTSTLALIGQQNQINAVVKQITAAREKAAEAERDKASKIVDDILTKAEALETLKVGFESEEAEEALKARIDKLAEELRAKLKIDVQLDTAGGKQRTSDDLLPEIVNRAGGGEIRGPGSETSDSILAWLSNREFVMRAAAVRKYGLGFMRAVNKGEFPRFAQGGLATPTVPRLSPAASPLAGGTAMHFHLPNGQTFTFHAANNEARGFKSAVQHLYTARGSRRR